MATAKDGHLVEEVDIGCIIELDGLGDLCLMKFLQGAKCFLFALNRKPGPRPSVGRCVSHKTVCHQELCKAVSGSLENTKLLTRSSVVKLELSCRATSNELFFANGRDEFSVCV